MASKKTDIWMPIFIGDLLADTSHLDAERTGAYLLMLFRYWRKGPLPNDLQDIVITTKLFRHDAPSIVQALLVEFFALATDGLWHHKRADIERDKWQVKKNNAVEKAELAAKARWERARADALSNTPSIPPSSAQDMLGSCPSPSPLPLQEKQKQKPSRGKREGKTKTEVVNEKHQACKEVIREYWKSKNPKDEMPWDGAEGKALAMFLSSSPDVTPERLRELLRYRYGSDVNHSERPSKWIRNALHYANGRLDRFGKPLRGGNGKIDRAIDAAARVIAEIESGSGPDAGELFPGSGTDREISPPVRGKIGDGET